MKYDIEHYLGVIAQSGSIREAAQRLEIPYSTLQYRISKAQRDQALSWKRPVEVSYLPPAKVPLEDRLDLKRRNFEALQSRKKADNWREHKVLIDGPIGIMWFGDPHIDDDGCNFPLLERDIEIARTTPGLLAANMGDTLNNWVGKLERLYAHQAATQDDALEMYQWFIESVPWWLWLFGNHCMWPTPNTNLMKYLAEQSGAATADWQAKIKLVFPNGRESKIWAAHDFKGHSMWNPLHGGMKRAAFGGGEADLYIAGDKHCWALFQNEDDQTRRPYWVGRARGYKYVDTYAELLGFNGQQHGASIVSVIDPECHGPGFMTCFADAEEGAEFLTWKRKHRK